ncbi:scarecrow-like protein 33 [Setaria italica]|uniref:Uncharacterized protein n=2 Tax=Setaria italica TaxID=4555 RepID=K3Y5U3_SETIT|nr:scarecrow-like protein 33 [Setaria italica]
MERDRPSSSIFLDLPPTSSQVDGSEDDGDHHVLPYISRMLMEDSIVDKFLCQYPDHPALVQAQQLFSHILSDASSSVLAEQPCNFAELFSVQSSAPAPAAAAVLSVAQGSNIEDTAFFLNGMATDAVESINSSLPAESTGCCMDVVSMAFFKGMEEASKFLPSDAMTVGGGGRGQKKRLDGDDDEAELGSTMGRSSKQMATAADGEESEEAAAREMLDQLMLNGCVPSAADMQELRAATTEMEKAPRGRRGTGAAVDLHTMLMRCAEAVAAGDRNGAADLLERIRRHSSPAGDGAQRLAHYFAAGLEARLAGGTGSRLYRSLMVRRSSLSDYLRACQLYMAGCCFVPVIFLFSSETICRAVAGRKKLHIVSYGLGRGLQWPDVLRRLGNRDGGPPEVRLTGIDSPLPGFQPAELVEETGRRLSDCARRFGVPFRFRAIAARSEDVVADGLDIDPDEVLVVVESTFHFRSLMDEGGVVTVDGRNTNPMDTVLNTIREMRPSVFIHAVINASYSTAFFLTRFREVLYHSTALFDMMDTVLPRDDDRRLLLERDVLAQCAVNVIACEGEDRMHQPRSYKQWQARSRRAGLRQLPLDRGIVQMLKDKVKEEYHKCFEISEDQQWLLQGWKGRVLYALSTWTAGDDLA